jgi:hypothetical protein
MADALYRPVLGRDSEGACGTHGYAPHRGSNLLARSHYGFDHIACSQALYPFGSLGGGAWEPIRRNTLHPFIAQSSAGGHNVPVASMIVCLSTTSVPVYSALTRPLPTHLSWVYTLAHRSAAARLT